MIPMEFMEVPFEAVIVGCGLDILLGEPFWMFHPVRWIGTVVDFVDSYRLDRPVNDFSLGIALAVFLPLGVAVFVGFVVVSIDFFPLLRFLLMSYFIWASLSLRNLYRSGKAVHRPLSTGHLEKARDRVSRIVGRDTENLSSEEVSRAGVESVAEGYLDGLVSPLFWLIIAGLPGMLLMKTVNTLDSMIGYRNDQYQSFGWGAARLDDLMNWIPARICLLITPVASFLVGLDGINSLKVGYSDRGRHPSPNAGHPEALYAGALNCRLGGPTEYDGFSDDKPLINASGKRPDHANLARSLTLLLAAGLIVEFSTVLITFYL